MYMDDIDIMDGMGCIITPNFSCLPLILQNLRRPHRSEKSSWSEHNPAADRWTSWQSKTMHSIDNWIIIVEEKTNKPVFERETVSLHL